MDFNMGFQSIEFQKYLGYDADTKEHKWQYKLIDSDFEVEVEFGVDVGVELAVAVIDTYEKRKLNVAANLALAFLYLHKNYRNISIQQIIEWNKQYNPKFAQYEKDLEKYMVLL